ncbi:MAG: response regulator [Candidatus Omnitrophica bacterium]|nr:response regulator [Candidatus Omnitrophota bacterium]
MARIIVLDDNDDILKPLLKRLKNSGYAAQTFSDPDEGWRAIQESPPDLIILDRKMPKMSGDVIYKKLGENSQLADIPVIFLTGKDLQSEKNKGLRLGVDDYITKPFDMGELLLRIENILKKQKIYKEKVWSDKLTGCINRDGFDTLFSKLFNGAKRYNDIFSIVMIDINEFKRINDLLGHHVGDNVLVQVVDILKKHLRESDFICRYGGDEFVIFLPSTAQENAEQVIKRILAEVENIPIRKGPAGERLKIGISIGVVSYHTGISSPNELFQLADKRMYENKFQSKLSQQSKKKVLVVEDEADIRKALLFRLKQAGFETFAAEDGQIALRIARALRPDLILLDLRLPKISGEEVCKTIREDDDPGLSTIPIIMLTAKTSEAEQMIGRIIGANYYATKPFNMDEIIKNVMRYASL